MKIKALLEETINQCLSVERVEQDPIGEVHRFDNHADQEVAALVASCLAYGRVEMLKNAIQLALAPLGEHPAKTLREMEAQDFEGGWQDFVYRMTRGRDLADLLHAMSVTLRNEGSLESLYASFLPSRPVLDRQEHLKAASGFVRELRSRRLRPATERGFRYLLPDPADGSACKRLHLFFRWVARPADGIDLGLWTVIDPSALVMPVDTHIHRIARYLGLLERKSPDGQAALQLTRRLAELHPADPLRYDFALCHLGISGQCAHRWSPEHCPTCPIESACTLANSSR